MVLRARGSPLPRLSDHGLHLRAGQPIPPTAGTVGRRLRADRAQLPVHRGLSPPIDGLFAQAPNEAWEKELRQAERRRRWCAAVALAREQQVKQHRATVLTEQTPAWRQAAEIRAFCQAARRARVGDAPVATDEADWLECAEAYAEHLDPLETPLRTPPDPPATREMLRELAKVDAYAYPWRSTPTAAGISPRTGQPTASSDPGPVTLTNDFALSTKDRAKKRLCGDGERGFHTLPSTKDSLVGVRLQVGVALGSLEALVSEEVLDLEST